MRLERINLEVEYLRDKIIHNGFRIPTDDYYTNIDSMINSQEYMDTEYRCNCGAFKGQDIVGQVCPLCESEIELRSLNFEYTGWIDLGEHKVVSPLYYNILKKVFGVNMLKFILGDYKDNIKIVYNQNNNDDAENKTNKKIGRVAENDIRNIIKKIPRSKQKYQGLGHDEFYNRFEEVITNCATKNKEYIPVLLNEKSAVFTSKIPIYSTAYRPTSKTSESMYSPKINKIFSRICANSCRLKDMVLQEEIIRALNDIQNDMNEAVDGLIRDEMSKKTGYIRSEIAGGTYSFSARSVIILETSLRCDEVYIPFSTAIVEYQYIITHRLAVRYNMTLEQAYLFVQDHEHDPIVIGILDEIINEGQYIMYLREPTDNIKSIVRAKIKGYKFIDTLVLPHEVLPGLNADFDGDAIQMFFLPHELVDKFEAFDKSCLISYVDSKVTIDLLEWIDICLGKMSL